MATSGTPRSTRAETIDVSTAIYSLRWYDVCNDSGDSLLDLNQAATGISQTRYLTLVLFMGILLLHNEHNMFE